MGHRILCADADAESRSDTVEQLEAELEDLDAEFLRAGTVRDANELLTRDVTAVITDYSFSDGTGLDIISEARETSPDAGCILYTETDPDTLDTDALRGSVTEYVGKNSVFGAERLGELLRTTLEGRTQGSYPIPQNEDERVVGLATYDLDDNALIDSLDRIANLAADHFAVDTASVNVITEHSQEFLACHGDASEWESMDREDSICTFTILEDDNVMTVEDVTEDPRFESRSDTLRRMGIRSYMGANLVTASGLVLGPLCVYDDEPRTFSAADKSYLSDLAAVAVEFIELHAQREAAGSPDGGRQ
jgi:CheY-like chemotaxis protein